jgi:hypothetical protein
MICQEILEIMQLTEKNEPTPKKISTALYDFEF